MIIYPKRILSFWIFVFLWINNYCQFSINYNVNDSISVGKVNEQIKKNIRINPDSAIIHSHKILEITNKLELEVEKGNSYNIIGIAHYYLGHLDSSLKYNQKALYLFNKVSDSSRYADVLINIGNVFFEKGDYDSAQYYFNNAFSYYQTQNNIKGQAKSCNNLGNCYNAVGHYKKAVEYYFRALKIEQKNKNLNGEAICNNNIGIMYHKLDREYQALEHYNRAYEIYKELDIKQNESIILNQIAGSYFNLGKIDTAFYLYQLALKISNSVDYDAMSAVIENNLGELRLKNHSYINALRHFKNAFQINKALGDHYSMSMNLIGQGKVLNKLNRHSESIPLLKKAYSIGNKINSIEVVKYASEELSLAYESTGNHRKSLDMYKLFKAMDDSILNQSNIEQITSLQLRYDFDILQQKQEYEQLQTEMEYKDEIKKLKLKRQRIIYLTLLILLIITSIFLIYFYKQKIRISKLKIDVNKNMQRILGQQMNPHFIFNTLKSIQNFILKNDTKKSNSYLVKFSKLIRKILENSQFELVSLKDELEALELYMEIESLRLNNKFDFKINIEESIDCYDVKVPSLLFQPYVENAIWHGISPKNGKGKIIISIKFTNKTLKCSISDNGVGRKVGGDIENEHQSLGSSITIKRINLLNSLYKTNILPEIIDLKDSKDSALGTKVKFSLPVLY